jgi:hypothetical protein
MQHEHGNGEDGRMIEKNVSERECRQDIANLESNIRKLENIVMPTLWTHFKWRFLGFWCFLWLFVFHSGVIYGIGLGVGVLLVMHNLYHLYDCKCVIAKARHAIGYIENYIKENHNEE